MLKMFHIQLVAPCRFLDPSYHACNFINLCLNIIIGHTVDGWNEDFWAILIVRKSPKSPIFDDLTKASKFPDSLIPMNEFSMVGTDNYEPCVCHTGGIPGVAGSNFLR